MLKAAAIVIVGLPLALLAAVLSACFATGVAIVDVREAAQTASASWCRCR